MLPHERPKPSPSCNEPGTLAEQLAAVNVAIYLGRRRGTDARSEWHDARRLVMPHTHEDQEAGQ